MNNSDPDTLKHQFFAPVYVALSLSKNTRTCNEYSDEQHLLSGIGRALQNVLSGRDWVQRMAFKMGISVSVRNFFLALASSRRKAFVQEISENVRLQADALLLPQKDPLAAHGELAGFAVYASDGHTQKASAHEEPIADKVRPVTHLYSTNLRTQSLAHLELATPGKLKKKEHELTTLKRIGGRALRMGEPKGVKVIQVYDPAVTDFRQWQKWKQAYGIYILTVEKKNSALMTVGENPVDRDDPRNTGVLSDELVGPSNGYVMRRITYEDPVSGKIYRFLTTELTLPPGLLAFLYKLRWDIEKIFDVVKNKTGEKKAWGKSKEAKTQQACFITLVHNLMLMLELQLENEEQITDQTSLKKRKARLEQDLQKALEANRTHNPLVINCQRVTQRSFQFIRWLRGCLEDSTSWREAVGILRPLMTQVLE
jgi:hypothetical protein